MRDTAIETVSKDCPEGAVDAEIAQIASEKQCASNDLGIASDVPSVTSSDTDREERVEVWN
jgi:hypothetical protein